MTLEASAKMPLPVFVSINPTTGELTINAGRAIAGTHYFVIKATNDVGSDTRECTLNVLEQRTAPVFAKESHNYDFSVAAIRREPTKFQINVTGSTPITYSLEPSLDIAGRSAEIPDGLSIDPATGVLTVGIRVASGSHYFISKAEFIHSGWTVTPVLNCLMITFPP